MTGNMLLDLHRAEEAKLGPCMEALPTDRMRAFVYAMLDSGCSNHFLAAKSAGYIGNENTLRVTAHRLAHDERVQAALQEEARRRLMTGSILAVNALLDIVSNPAHKSRLQAANSILDRTGLHGLIEQKVTHEHTIDDKKAIARIRELALTLGVDPVKLLGTVGVVDAEFTEIPAATDEGLEDLL